MADEKMKIILKELKIKNVIDVFEKNEIKEEDLQYLTEELIAQLIEPIAPRARFLNYWKRKYIKDNILIDSLDNLENPSKKRNIINDGASTSGTSNEIQKDSDKENYLERQQAFSGVSQYIILTMPSIRKLLDKESAGQRIIKMYDKNCELSEKNRTKMCDILISYLENKHARRSNELCNKISNLIVKDFPTECPSTYFVPPISKKHSLNNKSIPARGKLINMWKNRDYESKKNEKQIDSQADSENNNDEEDPQFQQSFDWLFHNRTPWDLVMSHWVSTFNNRHLQWKTSKDTQLVNIFEKWPILCMPDSYKLIQSDFIEMKICNIEVTIKTWMDFFNKLVKKIHINKRDDTAGALFDSINDRLMKDEDKVAAMLMLISHLIPPKGMLRLNKQYYKASIADSKDSIIRHVTNANNIQDVKEDIINKAKILKISVQPYIIVVGSKISTITHSYVCIDNVLYNATSTLHAFDICFKSYHVFHVKYPVFSEHLWMLFQRGLYKLTTKWDKIIPHIENLIEYLISETYKDTQQVEIAHENDDLS